MLGAGGVEQVVEGVDRGDELRPAPGDPVGPVPLPAVHEFQRRPGQHGQEPALGVEMGDERREVVLVGALAVDEQQQPVGLLPAPHRLRHERPRHGPHPTGSISWA